MRNAISRTQHTTFFVCANANVIIRAQSSPTTTYHRHSRLVLSYKYIYFFFFFSSSHSLTNDQSSAGDAWITEMNWIQLNRASKMPSHGLFISFVHERPMCIYILHVCSVWVAIFNDMRMSRQSQTASTPSACRRAQFSRARTCATYIEHICGFYGRRRRPDKSIRKLYDYLRSWLLVLRRHNKIECQ